MDSLEHLITRSIKSYYKNRLYAPIILLAVLIVITLIFPIVHMIVPHTYTEQDINLSEMYSAVSFIIKMHFLYENMDLTYFSNLFPF